METFGPENVYSACCLKTPAELPPRTHEGTLSPYFFIKDGQKVCVPWNSIVRNRAALDIADDEPVSRHNCLPEHVIVLRALDPEGDMMFGWFVKRKNKLVERLPKHLCTHLAIKCHKRKCISSLVALFPDSSFLSHTLDFDVLATLRFTHRHAMLKEVARRALGKKSDKSEASDLKLVAPRVRRVPKRRRPNDDCRECAVCMEEKRDFAAKNRRCKCGTLTCLDCAERMRGLCPICNRSEINGRFECFACFGVFPMEISGFPCISCGQARLCKACYCHFEAGCCCDVLS